MNKTCLADGVYVSKDHPRIVFRGALDSLQANILEAQVLAAEKNEEYYANALGEILDFVRELMCVEVKEQPAAERKLFGMSLDDLHEQSHKVKEFFGFAHPLPDHTMGALSIRLNTLRTRVRETELIAAGTLSEPRQNDIVHALNRLSSAVYWLFCRSVSGKQLTQP